MDEFEKAARRSGLRDTQRDPLSPEGARSLSWFGGLGYRGGNIKGSEGRIMQGEQKLQETRTSSRSLGVV